LSTVLETTAQTLTRPQGILDHNDNF